MPGGYKFVEMSRNTIHGQKTFAMQPNELFQSRAVTFSPTIF